jgi:hypothetical protein
MMMMIDSDNYDDDVASDDAKTLDGETSIFSQIMIIIIDPNRNLNANFCFLFSQRNWFWVYFCLYLLYNT